MAWSPRQILGSFLASLVAGYLLWPPGHVYWTAVLETVGDTPTVGLILLLAILVGAAIVGFGPVSPRNFGVGAGLAYATGMALVEVVHGPDSPVHFLLYAGFLSCAVFGGIAATTLRTD
ncbi:MAG: hypothetical protein V5A24_01925 [Haloarculaceae archaeon]